LWIYQERHPRARKGIHVVEAGNGEWNVVTDSGATPWFRQKLSLRIFISPWAAALALDQTGRNRNAQS
jgi:hypothetical protein